MRQALSPRVISFLLPVAAGLHQSRGNRTILADRHQIEHVFLYLYINAWQARAGRPGGKIMANDCDGLIRNLFGLQEISGKIYEFLKDQV